MKGTKVQFDEFFIDKVKHSLHTNLSQSDDSSAKTKEERRKIGVYFKFWK